MNTFLTIVGSSAVGGAAGWIVSALTCPTGRRRGPQHRRLWQRGPRPDPYSATDVPVTGLDPDAPTEELPIPGGGVRIPEGEQ